jgi:hypothetical protein
LAPQADPHLTSIVVSNAVGLPLTMPATYIDPVATNNRVTETVKIIDSGTDPVYARFTIAVRFASELAFTADAGLSCGAAVPNVSGTGFSRVCTTSEPLASGASLNVQLTLAPSTNPLVHAMTVTGTAAKMFGTVADLTPLNNRSLLKAAITDSADLATTLSHQGGRWDHPVGLG